MKTNKGLPTRYIGDNNVRYNNRREGYMTPMTDRNTLSEMPKLAL